MNTSNWMKRFAAIVGSALFGLMLATVSYAATESVVAQVTFADLITITENNSLRYGVLDEAITSAESVIIAPDSSVTDAGSNVLGGTQGAANLTVGATASQTLSIQVTSITNNTGFTLGSFICSYDGGADTACQAAPYTPGSVLSATLLIGASLTGDDFAVPGVSDGSFIVTITYQ